MPLQDKLDALKAEFKTKAPAEVAAAIQRAIDELVETGQSARALKTGSRVPSFTLPDAEGKIVSSTDLLAKGPLVITFYRGVWCPYCNMDLQAIEAAAAEIRARGASLVAISQQTPANSRKSQRDNGLSFPILVDRGGEVAAAFGLRWLVPDDLRDIHSKLGADLPTFNGEPSWTLPMPARYVIAPDGMIAYGEVNPDYTHRPEPSDLFPTLERLQRLAR